MPRMYPAGGAHDAPPDLLVGWGGGHLLPNNPTPLGASILAPSALAARRLVSSNTPLIGSIVISLSRCCLPNDEGPDPPNIFS